MSNPHSPQNRASGSFCAEQFGQVDARAVPHDRQNRRPARFSVPHDEQITLA